MFRRLIVPAVIAAAVTGGAAYGAASLGAPRPVPHVVRGQDPMAGFDGPALHRLPAMPPLPKVAEQGPPAVAQRHTDFTR